MTKPKSETLRIEHPRDVANKSDRDHLLRAIRMALDIESPALRHNTQTFNRNRYKTTAALPDYDALKDQVRAIKEKSIANLPELLQTLKGAVHGRGGHVFVAATAEDACRHIVDLCRWRAIKLVVKGKTITSEEIHLNRALEADGIEVAESDLAEFILQVANEQPSHFVAPALHYSRERITALFRRKFKTDLPLDTGELLTKFAREKLREKFLYADAGITGANLIAADTGTLMLVESEGNIRMSSTLPPLHIAIAGVEKVIPTRREMAPFVELLAASATGQSLSAYTSFLSPPLTDPSFALPGKANKPREFYLVLIDNGRFRMRDDPVFREALYCIRCGACLNSCANFQTVGGHAFGGEAYSGWPVEQIVVIDTDQGQSGASAADREGFQRLVADVGLGKAGIVLGLEVSRLARNNADWHRLLEISALAGTLICDEDGLYDPADFNDRLLLGLKGTMSDAELHFIRARLQGGILSKARRGELPMPLPVGLVTDPAGKVVLDPDRAVQDAIRHLFQTFRADRVCASGRLRVPA